VKDIRKQALSIAGFFAVMGLVAPRQSRASFSLDLLMQKLREGVQSNN
jgi:hypothetical protein